MLDVMLLYVVLLTIAYVGVEQWQRHGTLRESALAVALMILAFVLIWALVAPIARAAAVVSAQTALVGPDTLGLVAAVAFYIGFVRFYFFSSRRQSSPTTTEHSNG
ncbi:MAG: hypothetical protein N3B17_09430 [Chlorobi bacterium]|jgi:hypothetical protein|nr:hypothetical protein [Chlorobiota bacterium]